MKKQPRGNFGNKKHDGQSENLNRRPKNKMHGTEEVTKE